MALRQLPCLLVCALFAALATTDIVPTNEEPGIASFRGVIKLQDINSRENLTDLLPLTKDAILNQPLEGKNLYNTNGTSVGNISEGEIAYLSCNSDDYEGFLGPANILEDAFDRNISAAILYSTTTTYCNFTNISENMQESSAIFTMTNRGDSESVLDTLNRLAVPDKFFVNVRRTGAKDDDSPQGFSGQTQNPLGPSPSTAVAMIILYSITGIITALFLVIIITGAVRAHRHPDRYGPRDVLGRPRQSRARGLGRAILDTIPIVKFGEREPPKPADVELGSTSESRNVDPTSESGAQNNQATTDTNSTHRTSQEEASRNPTAEQQSGIAPAQPLASGAAAAPESNPIDEGLGCSICTDDFERGQDIRVLPCDHKFHPECVDPWLLNVSGTCPLCRVDLRPTTSHTSDEHDPDLLAPPLQSEVDLSHRRRSAFRDILSLRSRPNASPEERISALRRLREQRRNGSGDVASGSANASNEDVAANRRSKRLSVRLSDVFSSRARNRRDESPQPGEPSSSSTPQPGRDDSPAPNPSPNSNTNPNEETDSSRRT